MSRAPAPVTRARVLGVRTAELERRTRTAIKRAAVLLEAAAYAWSEIDCGIESDLEEVILKLSDIDGEGGTLADAMARLAAPWGAE